MPATTRTELLLSLFNNTGLGLEIGPGFNPLLPKAQGFAVETLDHASQQELVHKYTGASGVDVSRIEPVDYVSTGASVFAAIGKPARYDYIVASHVIEHTTDLLGFLQDCEKLLKPEGALVLAIPDKRFSFDVLRPASSTGDVLQAHLEERTRHNPGALFDEVAYNVLRGGALAWPADNHETMAFFRPLADAKAIYEQACRSSEFIDIHAWQFTPSSFRLIANDLHEIGFLGLREQSFHDGWGTEFMVSLARQGLGPQLARIELAERAIAEHRAVLTGPAPAAEAASETEPAA